MRIGTLTIVGVGLIGGSIGLAARRRGLVARVIGLGRQAAALERAREMGAIDEFCLDMAEAVRRADVVVFCTPVNLIAEQVLAVAPNCRPGTLLTDAGSTKTTIVLAIDGKLPPEVHFVGSHPLAGSEKSGCDHADAELFQGRIVVVTPTGRSDPSAVERVTAFWQSLDVRTRFLDPEEHDAVLALTSHVPHLVASALASMLPEEFREMAATGFRDTTRIAAGDPSLWTAIFRENHTQLLDVIRAFEDRVVQFKQALMVDDWAEIEALLAEGKRNRDALGN